MSACPAQRRSSTLGVVATAQKLLVNGGSDRRESHAPAGKMKLNPVPPNASEMMSRFALVRGPVYSLTPSAFHLLCRSINVSRLPGRRVKRTDHVFFLRKTKVSREQSREMKAEIEGQLALLQQMQRWVVGGGGYLEKIYCSQKS